MAWHGPAVLHVLRVGRLPLVIARDVHADRAAGHRAAHRGEDVAPAAADLVPQDAPDHRTGQAADDIALVVVRAGLFVLDPAALLARADHGSHPGDLRVVHAFIVAAAII